MGSGDDDVDSPLVLRNRHRTEPGHGVDGDQGARFVRHLRQRRDVVDHSGRGLGEGGEHHLRRGLREPALEVGGLDPVAPARVEMGGLGAESVAQLDPALAELAA